MRLIFQGRFLHENVTLGGRWNFLFVCLLQIHLKIILFIVNLFFNLVLKLPLGKTTVMHLVPRERLPQVNSQGKNFKFKFIILIQIILSLKICYNRESISEQRSKWHLLPMLGDLYNCLISFGVIKQINFRKLSQNIR